MSALGWLVKVGYGLVMKPVDAVGHLVFVFVVLDEIGYGAEELMGVCVVSGDSPEPEPAVTVTV